MAQGRVWRRALVTGASSGIGASFARLLGEADTDVVLVARSVQRLEELAEQIRRRSGVRADVLAADLSDPAQLAAVEERVATSEDPVDLLVNNAGYGFHGEFGARSVDAEDAEIRVNVIALMRLCHVAARCMPERGGGGIINVGSVAGFQPAPESANYSATKAYVVSFSQSLHEELKPKGVNVTVLCPGLTRTEFQDRGGFGIDLPGIAWQDPDEVARAGIGACARGSAVEVPGWQNKAIVHTCRVLPMSLQRFTSGQVSRRLRA